MSPIQISGNIAGVGNASQGQGVRESSSDGTSFGDALQTQVLKQAGVTLSAHAQRRLAERNVQLNEDTGARLGAAVDRISEKGADKSLVLMDNLALVVSAKNRVVITALDSTNAKDGVFTGIDSAVIA